MQGKKFLGFLLRLSVISVLVGCGDKSVEEYQNQKVRDEYAKIRSVEGFYSGDLISKLDESKIGSMFLKLEADTVVKNQGTDASNSRQAVLKGNIKIENESQTILPLLDGFFDHDSGNLQFVVEITRRDEEKVRLTVNATAKNDVISGVIQASEYPDRRSEFTLHKIEPKQESKAVVLKDETAPPETAATYQWRSVTKYDYPVDLKMTNYKSNDVETFAEKFIPIRLVDASIIFDERVWVSFQNARWDYRKGTLHGETRVSVTGAMQQNLILDCNGFAIEGADPKAALSDRMGWNCMYQATSQGRNQSFNFRPIAKAKN